MVMQIGQTKAKLNNHHRCCGNSTKVGRKYRLWKTQIPAFAPAEKIMIGEKAPLFLYFVCPCWDTIPRGLNCNARREENKMRSLRHLRRLFFCWLLHKEVKEKERARHPRAPENRGCANGCWSGCLVRGARKSLQPSVIFNFACDTLFLLVSMHYHGDGCAFWAKVVASKENVGLLLIFNVFAPCVGTGRSILIKFR